MTRSIRVAPESLHERLLAWGRWASYDDFGVARGYPTESAFTILRVDVSRGHKYGWDAGRDSVRGITAHECAALDNLINGLEPKFVLALMKAYRPGKAASAQVALHAWSECPRSWTRWAHEAAALILREEGRLQRGFKRKEPQPV